MLEKCGTRWKEKLSGRGVCGSPLGLGPSHVRSTRIGQTRFRNNPHSYVRVLEESVPISRTSKIRGKKYAR